MLDEVAQHGLGRPLREARPDPVLRAPGLETERVPAEIDAFIRVLVGRRFRERSPFEVGFGGDDEFVSEVAERIPSVEPLGVCACELVNLLPRGLY